MSQDSITQPPDRSYDGPRKRYRFTVTIDAHDFDHMQRTWNELDFRMAVTVERKGESHPDCEGFSIGNGSSSDYTYEMAEVDPTMTRERYDRELNDWWLRERAKRPR